MIGLAVDGTASLGIIYQPVTEKLYYAESGSGAFVTENRETRLLQVSRETNPPTMTIALSRPHHSAEVGAIQRTLGITNTISLGSMGLKVGLICEGQAHLYLQTSPHTSQWDTCAPDVILYEAGGRLTDLYNNPLRYNTAEVRNVHGVIASNGPIHDLVARTAQFVLTNSHEPATRARTKTRFPRQA
jgi:3'(2'), 5'-bisphosphate nucleotidase